MDRKDGFLRRQIEKMFTCGVPYTVPHPGVCDLSA